MLTEGEKRRYARQVMMIGEDGQERLKACRVLLAGAGGLGSVIATYLVAAGVGKIRLVDCDVVEESNLNRQFLHWPADLGRPKSASAADKLSGLNPLVDVEMVQRRIDEGNVGELVAGCDVVVDAMDNFPIRYLLNGAALKAGVPFVHGAVRGLSGQATTVIAGRGPCLRCIFPQAPPAETFPIVGATCGVIGSVQATETVKVITGLGTPLAGRLFIWDGRECRGDTIAVERNEACPACGPGRRPGD